MLVRCRLRVGARRAHAICRALNRAADKLALHGLSTISPEHIDQNSGAALIHAKRLRDSARASFAVDDDGFKIQEHGEVVFIHTAGHFNIELLRRTSNFHQSGELLRTRIEGRR